VSLNSYPLSPSLTSNVMSISPTSRSLPIDIHRDSEQADRNRQATNREEDISHTLCCNPAIQVIGQSESEHVLNEIHGCECFTRFVTMAIDDVGHDSGGSELDSEVDEAEADDDGDGPWVLCI